jgi:hypothetical protein
MQFVDIIYLLPILRITIINVVNLNNIILMDYYGKGSVNNNTKLLPIILLIASASAIVAMFIFQFFGVYFFFFFFFLPLTFSLPWSIKRLWGRKARKQWNVEDLR